MPPFPMMCVHCTLRALVKCESVPTFDETPQEHIDRCHPNAEETERERKALETAMDSYLRKTPNPRHPEFIEPRMRDQKLTPRRKR